MGRASVSPKCQGREHQKGNIDLEIIIKSQISVPALMKLSNLKKTSPPQKSRFCNRKRFCPSLRVLAANPELPKCHFTYCLILSHFFAEFPAIESPISTPTSRIEIALEPDICSHISLRCHNAERILSSLCNIWHLFDRQDNVSLSCPRD
jgi:hypothetical protein